MATATRMGLGITITRARVVSWSRRVYAFSGGGATFQTVRSRSVRTIAESSSPEKSSLNRRRPPTRRGGAAASGSRGRRVNDGAAAEKGENKREHGHVAGSR